MWMMMTVLQSTVTKRMWMNFIFGFDLLPQPLALPSDDDQEDDNAIGLALAISS